jgi:hypothetical protein
LGAAHRQRSAPENTGNRGKVYEAHVWKRAV